MEHGQTGLSVAYDLPALMGLDADSPLSEGEVGKTGVAISFVYAITACLFFVGVIAVVGTRWVESEPGPAQAPMSRVLAQAFLSLFLGAMLFGLIYSTVISFFVAKRRSEE